MSELWLKTETSTALQDASATELEQILGIGKRKGSVSALAVRILELKINDNRKWFGEADIRLDTLVLSLSERGGLSSGFYQPKTFKFPRVHDGESLAIDNGLLIYYGEPKHFLDISIMVSRDASGTPDLETVLIQEAAKPATRHALDVIGEALKVTSGATVALPLRRPQPWRVWLLAALGQSTSREHRPIPLHLATISTRPFRPRQPSSYGRDDD